MLNTLVFQADNLDLFLVIMFGDMEVSIKKLANYLRVKKVTLCDNKIDTNWTRYQFGETSPFGTRNRMKVLVPKEVLNLDEIDTNGGRRGLILRIEPNTILEFLDCKVVQFSER